MNEQDLSKKTNVHQRPQQYLYIAEKLKAGKCKVKNKGLASGISVKMWGVKKIMVQKM